MQLPTYSWPSALQHGALFYFTNFSQSSASHRFALVRKVTQPLEAFYLKVKKYWHTMTTPGKGQLISKCLFGIFNSPKNKRKIRLYFNLKSNCFRLFFWENWRHQKDISKLTHLYKLHLFANRYLSRKFKIVY